MQVRDVMTRGVVTARESTPTKDVVAIIERRRINAVPIVDGSGRLVGIVAQHDLIALEDPGGSPAELGKAGDVMHRDVKTLSPDAPVSSAAHEMLAHGHRSMPVVDGEALVGIVSRYDLLKTLDRDDRSIAEAIGRIFEATGEVLRPVAVTVTHGIVHLAGGDGARVRTLAEAVARSVDGVIDVRWDG